MKIKTKKSIKIEDVVLPKGIEGNVVAITNKDGNFVYHVKFSDIKEYLLDESEIIVYD